MTVTAAQCDTITPPSCTPTGPDNDCDGLDDDCDSGIDEGYVPQSTSCGVGACAATGVTSCVSGAVHNSCTPGTPAANDASCNGVDDDCSGAADEDYAPQSTSCGVGACAATGVTSCASGTVHNSCAPGAPAANDASCNGVDEDCSGAADEDYAPQSTSCGVGACTATGTTSCVAGAVQNSCAPRAAGTDDSCDGADQDCDGRTDEAFVGEQTSCGLGACAEGGATSCVDGHVLDSCVIACEAACSDNVDDDSDGASDCEDTDCDGAPECVQIGDPCDEDVDCALLGPSALCIREFPDGYCTLACDGDASICPEGTGCDSAFCLANCLPGGGCANPSHSCESSVFSPSTFCRPMCNDVGCPDGSACNELSGDCRVCGASDIACDGFDDDCDGSVDEDFAAEPVSCGVGACAAMGMTMCDEGAVLDDCPPEPPAVPDTSCNGVDDDCDGKTDEAFAPQPTTCGLGACTEEGLVTCVDGELSDSCTFTQQSPEDTTCDAVDDDCDGVADEDFAGAATTCGTGACARTGSLACQSGVPTDTCTPGTAALRDTSCDGVDNDCDGEADEDFASYLTGCGEGACVASGTSSCVDGALVDNCQARTPSTSTDSSCDGIDDDCDGENDEEYVGVPTTCGLGACAAAGVTHCSGGRVINGCAPGTPSGSDATCDGVDQDCDGSADEAFGGATTICGTGTCARGGVYDCIGGAVVDTCTPGSPGASDATCNGQDEDCDGTNDEHYASIGSLCGIGACKRTGTSACVQGLVAKACTPGAPAANDATCDGIDDDCDGRIDENYTAVSHQCGTGLCQRTGLITCVGGALVDACVPGGAASDALCNGLDDDCNGTVDEDYVGTPTSCGAGACVRTGSTACIGGAVQPACTPGAPGVEGTGCDGVDQDCDGQSDENYLTTCALNTFTFCWHGQVVSQDCQDNNLCNGQESCAAGACQPGTPVTVEDGDPCTFDSCNSQTGVVTHSVAQPGDGCSNGNACDGEETCEVAASCAPLAGAVAHWAAEGNANDSVGTHHGVVAAGAGTQGPQPAPTFGTGIVGQAFSFDGINEGIDLSAHAAALDLSGQASFVTWVRFVGPDLCKTLVYLGQDPSHNNVLLVGNGCTGMLTNELITYAYIDGGISSTVGYTTGSRSQLIDNNWHQVAVTLNGTSTRMYLDGLSVPVSVGGGTAHGRWGGFANPVNAALGARNSGVGYAAVLNGLLDHVTLYDRVLSDFEIAGLYEEVHSGLCSSGGSGGPSGMACLPGDPPNLNDGKTCTDDSCDPVLGVQHVPTPGVACSDSSSCTTGDTCTATGTCVGTPIDVSDGDPCTTDICNGGSPPSHITVANGSTCTNGTVCDGLDRCRGRAAGATCAALPSGAVALWPGDDYYSDVVGTAEVAYGQPQLPNFQSDPNGSGTRGFSFDGASQHLDLSAHAEALDLAGPATIELWLQPVDDTCRTVFQLEQDDTHRQLLQVGNGCTSLLANELVTWSYENGATRSVVAYATTTRNSLIGVRKHLALTFDGTTTRIYLNGTAVTTAIGEGTNHGDWGAFAASIRAAIGARLTASGPTQAFKGMLDEVTIYNRALSASEIAAIAVQNQKCWKTSCEFDVPVEEPDDGDPCTIDSCDPVLGDRHVRAPAGSACDDGDLCTAATTCNVFGQCKGRTADYCETIGNQCTADADCGVDGPAAHCLTEPEAGVPGGRCVLECDPHEPHCPSGTACNYILPWPQGDTPPPTFVRYPDSLDGFPIYACWPTCEDSGDCGDRAYCADLYNGSYCWFGCNSSDECLPDFYCDCPQGTDCLHSSECYAKEPAETSCANAIDEDLDGAIDCDDSDCNGSPDCGEICDNNIQDDADGKEECLDSECDVPCEICDGGEFGTHFALPFFPGIDEDLDGLADCHDPDCIALDLCHENNLFTCVDGEDNDVDGKVDCADPECPIAAPLDCRENDNPRCADGKDNDGDGLVDCVDPSCASSAPCAENTTSRCTDGVDNDNDGSVDCADTGCRPLAPCLENTHANCHDDIDNDLDGITDCADSDCDYDPPTGRMVTTCTERGTFRCNDGVDNDEDGPADCLDPSCACFERCDDGVDNDGNGARDCADYARCLNDSACVEDCADGVDNNADGRIDCLDVRCRQLPQCIELCANTSDTSCNGRDDDCDGRTDEEFVPTPGNCGTGACLAQSQMVCVAGALQCRPTLPGSESCDGQDNDCDGTTDEGQTRCQTGNLITCVGGAVHSSPCNDNNVCNGVETCGTAACQPGVPLVLDDGNDCTLDQCNPTLGPTHAPRPAGSPCEDGNRCTQGSTCGVSPVCGGGSPVVVDDGDPCSMDGCDPATGPTYTYLPAGALCEDGDACNGEERCLPGFRRFALSPRATFLRVQGFDPQATSAQPFELSTLGIAPGDRIELRSVGSFTPSEFTLEPLGRAMHAVFSSSAVLNASFQPQRVPGALASDAPAYRITPTIIFANDIPQDFAVGTTGTVVTVPPGATHLFVAASDLYLGENRDDDGDFGFEVRVVAQLRPSPAVVAVRPRTSFLQRLDDAGNQAAHVLRLADYGLAPHDRVDLRAVGALETASGQLDTLVAVFSADATLLPASALSRVTSAIASDAPNYVTVVDVAKDFLVPQSGVSVTVPEGAAYLVVGTNTETTVSGAKVGGGKVGTLVDENGDFGLAIGKTLGSLHGCTAGAQPELDDGNACTADACNPLTGVTHTALPGGAATCAQLGAECGPIDDGCGGSLDCGSCILPEVCGSSRPNECGPPALAVTPRIKIGRQVNAALLGNGARIIEPANDPAAALAFDGRTPDTAYNIGSTPAPKVLTVELMGEAPLLIDEVRARVSSNADRLEVWISDREAFDPVQLVKVAEQTRLAGVSDHVLRFAPVAARFVRLVIAYPQSSLWSASVHNFEVMTRSRDGGVVSLWEGGARLRGTSNPDSTNRPEYAFDYSPTTAWRAQASGVGSSTIELTTRPGEKVSQLELASAPQRNESIRNFELQLSATGFADADFTTVLAATASQVGGVYTFGFPPTEARFARLRILSTYGQPATVPLFRLYSESFGGAVVPFEDATAYSVAVAEQLWSFGDGATSTEANPVHHYAGPGEYEITLTVRTVDGAVGTARTRYRVLQAPSAAFGWDPEPAVESGSYLSTIQNFSLVDRTVLAPGEGLLSRTWTAPAILLSSQAERPSVRFRQDGPVEVTLDIVDTQLLPATATRTIDVLNRLPEVDAGRPSAGQWGEPTIVGLGSTAIEHGFVDAEELLRCRWDFGDGEFVEYSCARRYNNLTLPLQYSHTYANPGTYSAALTVRDDHGSVTDTVSITQHKRLTTLVPLGLFTLPADGQFSTRVQLVDSVSGEPLAGRSVRIKSDTQEAEFITNPAGVVQGTLQFTQLSFSTVEYSFDGDDRYFGSSEISNYVAREGDTEPQLLPPSRRGHEGSHFVVGFPQNGYNTPSTGQGNFVGLLVTSQFATTVTVSAPGIGFSKTVPVVPHALTSIDLPLAARMGHGGNTNLFNVGDSGEIESKGIEVSSDDPISVYGFDYLRKSTDGYVALPTSRLGNHYLVLGYDNYKGTRYYTDTGGTQVGIVASEDGTRVKITPTADVAAGPNLPNGAPKGIPFEVTLNRLQTFQIVSHSHGVHVFEDLSGTEIASTKPVAVYGGHVCATIGDRAACDHIVEQMPPVQSWGTHFITAGVPELWYRKPLDGDGDYLRVLAAEDGTQVHLDGRLAAVIDRGEFAQFSSGQHEAHELVTSAPVLVAQYAKSAGGSDRGIPQQDPMMTLVPAVTQYGTGYELGLATPNIESYIAERYLTTLPPGGIGELAIEKDGEVDYWVDSFIAIMAKVADVGGIRLDGEPIAPAWFVAGEGEYAVAKIPVAPGYHGLSHERPGTRFGAIVYGLQEYDSYGYPGGIDLGAASCEPEAARPGDQIDNDCDGVRDEERLNGLDDDGDGVKDEDLAALEVPNRAPQAFPSTWDYFGNLGTEGPNAGRLITERYALNGFDPDGDELQWRIESASHNGFAIEGSMLRLTAAGRVNAWAIVRASDGELESEPVTVEITAKPTGCETTRPEGVARLCNRGPYFQGGTEGHVSLRLGPGEVIEYSATVYAHDADRDLLSPFELVEGPEGLTLDPETGVVRWIVNELDVGQHEVKVRVRDPHGEFTDRGWTIAVETSPTIQNPIIDSSPPTTARIGETYAYQVAAHDPLGGPLYYAVTAGPRGMSIDANGRLTWTPGLDDAGSHVVVLRVSDRDRTRRASQIWTIEVEGSPLRFLTSPPLQVTVGDEYHYVPRISDATAGGPHTYAWNLLGDLKEGMQVDLRTGEVLWTPQTRHVGVVRLTLEVKDALGNIARQHFSIDVQGGAVVPRITSTPVRETVAGGVYVYDVNAADYGEREVLTYSLVDGPPGAVIDPVTGVIQWLPEAPGYERFQVRVSDTTARSSDQVFYVEVAADDHAPLVTVTATPRTAGANQSIALQLTATDDVALATRAIEVDGVPLTLDSAGRATFTSATPGRHTVVGRATDPSGNTGTAQIVVGIVDPADTTGPDVSLTAPIEDEELTYIHDVIGTAADTNLLSYELAVRPIGELAWVAIGSGESSVVNGLLGRIDTTLLENGYFELRLRAQDANGATNEVIRPFRVDGQAKVGVVELSFVDMVVPMAGIPLTVVRKYDSRIKRKEDFGYGWTLDIKQGAVQHNRPVAEGFAFYTDVHNLLGCVANVEQRSHYTEVRLSARERYIFRQVVAPTSPFPVNGPDSALCQARVVFELVEGTTAGAELLIIDDSLVLAKTYPNPNNVNDLDLSYLVYDTDPELVFNPREFRLVLKDGRSFDLRAEDGIFRVQDRNGNSLSINNNGISHSSGKSILFERDGQGRITSVVDPLGRRVQYGYDLNGDLVRVTDQVNSRTGFVYDKHDHPHHLDRILRSDGTTAAAMDYDAAGRLTSACDAEGACTRNDYDLYARVVSQFDPTDRPIAYEYDARGNVVRKADGLDHETLFHYDEADNLRRTEGPDGSVATFTYDASRNLLTRVLPYEADENPSDFTYVYTYNDRNDRETVTLPGGGVIDYDYDAAGNLSAIKDGAGNVIESMVHNADGTLGSRTNRFGTTTYDSYTANGLPRQITDPFGVLITLDYDSGGQLRARTERGVTSTTTYDALGREQTVDYGNGAKATFEYADPNDRRWTGIRGPTFGRVTRSFTATGRLGSWTEPNGDEFTRFYDAAGRVIEEIDALGNSTTTSYDAAGRLEAVHDVTLNATTTFVRDAVGNVTAVQAPDGSTTRTDYRAGSRVATRWDSRNYPRHYTSTAITSEIEDALGRTSLQVLSPYGLMEQSSFEDEATLRISYAGATGLNNSGSYPTEFVDEMNRSRIVGYDTHGRARQVTDLSGAPWEYEFATVNAGATNIGVESGTVTRGPLDTFSAVPHGPESEISSYERLSSILSPEGERTLLHYDERGALASIEHSDGAETVHHYDEQGRRSSTRLPDGTGFSYQYDAIGREIARQSLPSGELRQLQPGPTNRVESMTDATGTTRYSYDARGRQSGIRYPDGSSIDRTFDARSRLSTIAVRPATAPATFITHYGYDGDGRLTSVRDPSNGVSTFEYDSVGNLTETHLPNGISTFYTYDARNRLIGVVHRDGTSSVVASFIYERSASGEPTRVTREDGSYRSFTYDDAQRFSGESYFAPNGTAEENVEYEYDFDANRTIRRSSLDEQEYSYIAGSRLSQIASDRGTESYTFDANGRLASVTGNGSTRTYEFGVDDELRGVYDDGVAIAEFQYDGQLRRVRSSTPTGTVRYLVSSTDTGGLELPHAAIHASSGAITTFVHALGRPFAKITQGSPTYYLHDGLGSVIGTVDGSGAVTGRFDYDPFGNARPVPGFEPAALPASGDFRFQGMWLDEATQLYLTPRRAYDPRTGRFLSRDQAAANIYIPETFYPYAFARQNPLLYVDPSGDEELDAIFSILQMVGHRGGRIDTTALRWLLIAQQYSGRNRTDLSPDTSDAPGRTINDQLPFQAAMTRGGGGEWCASFVSMVMMQAGYPGGEFATGGSMGAREWEGYGLEEPHPYRIGTIMALDVHNPSDTTVAGHHVGFYMGNDAIKYIDILGANQERLTVDANGQEQSWSGVWTKTYSLQPQDPLVDLYGTWVSIHAARWPSMVTYRCLRPGSCN